MTTVFDITDRLQGLRQRGPVQWSARCPAHEDRGPSLSVKALSDGRILMHCFAGCNVADVVGALGMDMQDLFPVMQEQAHWYPPVHRPALLSKGQALELLAAESMLVAVVAANVAKGIELTAEDKARLVKATGRIAHLRQEAMS